MENMRPQEVIFQAYLKNSLFFSRFQKKHITACITDVSYQCLLVFCFLFFLVIIFPPLSYGSWDGVATFNSCLTSEEEKSAFHPR